MGILSDEVKLQFSMAKQLIKEIAVCVLESYKRFLSFRRLHPLVLCFLSATLRFAVGTTKQTKGLIILICVC